MSVTAVTCELVKCRVSYQCVRKNVSKKGVNCKEVVTKGIVAGVGCVCVCV